MNTTPANHPAPTELISAITDETRFTLPGGDAAVRQVRNALDTLLTVPRRRRINKAPTNNPLVPTLEATLRLLDWGILDADVIAASLLFDLVAKHPRALAEQYPTARIKQAVADGTRLTAEQYQDEALTWIRADFNPKVESLVRWLATRSISDRIHAKGHHTAYLALIVEASHRVGESRRFAQRHAETQRTFYPRVLVSMPLSQLHDLNILLLLALDLRGVAQKRHPSSFPALRGLQEANDQLVTIATRLKVPFTLL